MDIINRSNRPVTIPLPGGKKLRLGPGKTGQITQKGANHPSVQKMVEAGTVKIAQSGDSGGPSSGGGGVTSSPRRGSRNSIRQSGDR